MDLKALAVVHFKLLYGDHLVLHACVKLRFCDQMRTNSPVAPCKADICRQLLSTLDVHCCREGPRDVVEIWQGLGIGCFLADVQSPVFVLRPGSHNTLKPRKLFAKSKLPRYLPVHEPFCRLLSLTSPPAEQFYQLAHLCGRDLQLQVVVRSGGKIAAGEAHFAEQTIFRAWLLHDTLLDKDLAVDEKEITVKPVDEDVPDAHVLPYYGGISVLRGEVDGRACV
mmetsp:Transcript_9889/g.30234  ORF Transcript_9889/g.30234 Transcript_9889/m.30234 type:complete len:224 (+) Transcript_9889:2062-2733(+)